MTLPPYTEMRCQLVREIATDLEALKCKKCGAPFRGIFAEDLEPKVIVEPQLLIAHPVSISATSAEARKISARIAVLIANAKARQQGT